MIRSPIRTLFVTQSKIFSGAEVNLLALLNTIDTHKITPYLCFNPVSGFDRQNIRQKVHMIPLELPEWRRKNVLLVAVSMLKLFLMLLKLHIDLVYVNVGTSSEFKFFAPLCQILRLPIILHLHIHEDNNSLRWIKANRANRILFPSRATMEAVLKTSPWLNREKCFYVHNAVDLAEYYPRATERLKKELGLRDNLPIIGIVGQLKKIKGQHLFLKMAQKLKELGVNGHFLIVGSDNTEQREYERFLKQKAAELGIQDQLIFLGYRTDIPEIMSLLDLLVVPSLREPFGRVVIEAMACGTPVVASAVDGILEIFEDGEGGLFCDVNDVDDLSAKVRYFFDNPGWWQKQRERAIANARQNYSQNKHTDIIEDHILHVFSRFPIKNIK